MATDGDKQVSKPYIYTLVLAFCLFINGVVAYETIEIEVKPVKCPGLYCGRSSDQHGNYSGCGACLRGWRPNEDGICENCGGYPTLYDWLYLGFMAMLAPALHWFFIDITNRKKNRMLIILHVSAFIESVVAALCTLLVSDPRGTFGVRSCGVKRLSDWYSMLYNPSPDYTSTLHCTQEMVYPLYTIVMMYYAFGLACMLVMRPFLSTRFVTHRGTKSIYAALYFFPVLVLIQAVFAGLIYYAFPYMVLVISVVTNAAHFAYFEDQSMKNLLRENVTVPRNLVIVLGHWILHAYGIIALTQLASPGFHAPLLCLVPFPAIFYILTVRFSAPTDLEDV